MYSYFFCLLCLLCAGAVYAGITQSFVLLILIFICGYIVIIIQKYPIHFFVIISVLFGYAYVRGYSSIYHYHNIKAPVHFEGCTVSFKGLLTRDLVVEENKTVMYVETDEIVCENSFFRKKVILRVSAPHYYQNFVYGDILSIEGIFSHPQPFETREGRSFAYDLFLSKDNVVGLIRYPRIQYIQKEHSFSSTIFIFKQSIVDAIHKQLPYPFDGLTLGMILGIDGALGKTLEESYRRAGLIHIVVLSGFNVTIIAEAIRRLMPFGYKTNLALSFAGIWIFAIMVGASATVVRASIMASIVLLVRGLHETYSVHHSLWLACVIMSLINPLTLAYDPSFHLSFLATCGIVYLSPHIEKWFAYIPNTYELRFTIAGTLATQIFVFPYLAYSMGEISIASFIVNVLTVSFVPFIMLLGFVLYVASCLSVYLTPLIVWALWVLIYYQLYIVEYAASFTYATIPISINKIWIIICIYLCIIAWTIWINVNKSKK